MNHSSADQWIAIFYWDNNRDKDIVVITNSTSKIEIYLLLYTKRNLDFAQQNIHQIQSQIYCSLYPKCRCPIQVTVLDDWANKCIQQQFELVLYIKKGGIWEVFSLHLLLLVHPFPHKKIFLLLESPGGRIWNFFLNQSKTNENHPKLWPTKWNETKAIVSSSFVMWEKARQLYTTGEQ